MDARRLAKALGWFSIALGAIEVASPGALARALGVRPRDHLIRAYGARELGAGLGLLRDGRKAPWLWGRVAGDALDLASLAAALRGSRRRGVVGAALAAVAGVTALDLLAARRSE